MPKFGLNNKVARAVPTVSTVTPRNIIVATGEVNILGFIKKIGWNQKRNVIPRYELGIEEVSYLAPGAIDGNSNTIRIEKFLVFEESLLEQFGKSYSQGALLSPPLNGKVVQGTNGYPQGLLDFNKPFDIVILRRGILNLSGADNPGSISAVKAGTGAGISASAENYVSGAYDNLKTNLFNPIDGFRTGVNNIKNSAEAGIRAANTIVDAGSEGGTGPEHHPYNLIVYRAFRECWFTEYSWEADTGEGRMGPIVETATIMYTYTEGRESNLLNGEEIAKVEQVWKEQFSNSSSKSAERQHDPGIAAGG